MKLVFLLTFAFIEYLLDPDTIAFFNDIVQHFHKDDSVPFKLENVSGVVPDVKLRPRHHDQVSVNIAQVKASLSKPW